MVNLAVAVLVDSLARNQTGAAGVRVWGDEEDAVCIWSTGSGVIAVRQERKGLRAHRRLHSQGGDRNVLC